MNVRNHFTACLINTLIIATTTSLAQKQGQEKIDSLLTQLNNYGSACTSPCLSDSAKVNLLNSIGWEFKFIDSDSAMYYGGEALKLSEKINWPCGIGQSYHQIASYYYNKGDCFKSVLFYNNALEIWAVLENNPSPDSKESILIRKSKTLGNLGSVYQAINYYSQALDCLLGALTIEEKLGNRDGMASKLGNLGNFYYHEKKYAKALEYYTKQMKIDEELQNKKRMGAFLGNLGLTYLGLGDTAKALEYEFKSLAINTETRNKKYLARDLVNIAMIYDYQKKYKDAADYYFKSLVLHKELNDPAGNAIVLGNIGSMYLDQKNYKEAEKYLVESIALSADVHDYETENQNLIHLTTLYENTGRYELALRHFKIAMTLKDSLFNEEKTREIAKKEVTHEFEKIAANIKAEQAGKDAFAKSELEKQKLIRNSIAGGSGLILLSSIGSFILYKRKRDAEQKQKETALSLQISETEMKALRSQMNPHFIFNALQSIQTFLISHRSEEANIYLLKFSKLMRAVLENSQHREISLKKDMQALELYMQLESIRLQHPFTYEFHIHENIDVENDTIPPLILQPFVENAIWHGLQYKTGPGHIGIYIGKTNNELHVTVEDDGVGRDMSKRVQHPMLLKKESLGMKLTEERLKILNDLKNINAQFKITDLFSVENSPSGTKVELFLPLEP